MSRGVKNGLGEDGDHGGPTNHLVSHKSNPWAPQMLRSSLGARLAKSNAIDVPRTKTRMQTLMGRLHGHAKMLRSRWRVSRRGGMCQSMERARTRQCMHDYPSHNLPYQATTQAQHNQLHTTRTLCMMLHGHNIIHLVVYFIRYIHSVDYLLFFHYSRPHFRLRGSVGVANSSVVVQPHHYIIT